MWWEILWFWTFGGDSGGFWFGFLTGSCRSLRCRFSVRFVAWLGGGSLFLSRFGLLVFVFSWV